MAINSFADHDESSRASRPAGAFEVRPALADDIEAILDLQSASGRVVYSQENLAETIADPMRHLVVSMSGGRVVGWAKTHHWDYADDPAPSGHYLGGVTVLPNWRRRGIGAALTAARLEWIWARTNDAWYVVNIQNQASIALHRRWGFEETARGPAFHTTTFSGGVGLLMHAASPADGLKAAQ